MTLKTLAKAPFPYFGGKTHAAPHVWAALGDVEHYVEPFCGSLAALLLRPHEANRTYHSETVNDADGLLVNAWRSIQLSPDETAEAASWPVTEADLTARHLAIVRWARERELERLMADPDWHDPLIGGWWIWGMSCWIGSGWCSGTGPWVAGDDGRIAKRRSGDGVKRQSPNVSDDGRGVNWAHAREPGVARQFPHVSDNGQGVNRPQSREPGVARQLPHVSDDGQGVNWAHAREPGVARQRPHVTDDGRGVNQPQSREPGVCLGDYHPMTMPEVRRWFAFLSARLRHVRILNGDWERALTTGVRHTLPVRNGGACGVFLDPPYGAAATRTAGMYAHDGLDIAPAVQAWCVANGDDPRSRIVLAGYDDEHRVLCDHGWREVEWFAAGFLRGGMANQNKAGHQQARERLWLSPHCLGAVEDRQVSLW